MLALQAYFVQRGSVRGLEAGRCVPRYIVPSASNRGNPAADNPATVQSPVFMAGVNSEMRDELSITIEYHYHDQVTPIGAAEHTVAHSGSVRDRVVVRNRQSGHAPYIAR